jgi:hypothetical protein
MDNKTEPVPNSAIADTSEPAVSVAPRKEFVEPDISEPVDILAATKFFLQVTGGGDV